MEWIKKNWIWVALAIAIIVIWYINSKKPAVTSTQKTSTTPTTPTTIPTTTPTTTTTSAPVPCSVFEETIFQQSGMYQPNAPKNPIARRGCGKFFKIVYVNCVTAPCNNYWAEISQSDYDRIKNAPLLP